MLTSPELGPLTCPNGTQAGPSTTYSCSGSYTVNATDLEQGQLTFSASGMSSTLSARVVAESQVQLTMVAIPQLDLDLEATSCNQTGGSGTLTVP